MVFLRYIGLIDTQRINLQTAFLTQHGLRCKLEKFGKILAHVEDVVVNKDLMFLRGVTSDVRQTLLLWDSDMTFHVRAGLRGVVSRLGKVDLRHIDTNEPIFSFGKDFDEPESGVCFERLILEAPVIGYAFWLYSTHGINPDPTKAL